MCAFYCSFARTLKRTRRQIIQTLVLSGLELKTSDTHVHSKFGVSLQRSSILHANLSHTRFEFKD